MFHVRGHRTLREGLSTLQSLLRMAQGTFKLPGGGPEEQDACPKEQCLELATRVISYPRVTPIPGNRTYDKMGRARDAGGCDVRRVRSFGTG